MSLFPPLPDSNELLARARARRTHPDTSHEAAADLTPEGLSALRLAVWNFLREVIEASELDAQIEFKDHGSSYRSRFADLEKRNLIHKTGRYKWQVTPGKTRKTRRIIWRFGPKPVKETSR
jgi:hypothetical protein